MANTYTQIYIQIVFAVQGRQNLILSKYKDELYKYITGIIRNKSQKLITINGMSDHLHLLIGLKPTMALSDLIKVVKSDSSNFINSKNWFCGKFSWQKGFGAFSYSKSQLNNVIDYIQNQEIHHTKRTFKDEYIALLEKFNVEFDDKYLFKWLD
jgi:REP element-mobilizing transposase RayT